MATSSPDDGRITREQYWRLVADGVIGPDDRVELLEGVIVSMSPQNPPHAAVVAALTRRLPGVPSVSLRVQLPLDLSEFSTPEPDLAVVQGSAMDYAAAHPTTALLVIEVADSSLLQDRLSKSRIYARAGIPEFWVVNLRQRCIEVYRDPDRDVRCYAASEIRRAGERLEPTSLPGLSIPVDEILPPA